MVHRLVGLQQPDRIRRNSSGVRVAVEAWKVAARDLHAHAMAFQKHVPGYPCVHCYPINFTGLAQFRLLQRIAVAQP